MIEVDSLLREVTSEAPSGENLEYNPRFLELEKAAQEQPARQVGNREEPAVPPDWSEVLGLSQALLAQTKDLRIAVYLTRALLNIQGLSGFAQGLRVLHGLVTRFWSSVHPQLDPEDDYDSMSRINVLLSLCHPHTTLRELRSTPLVISRAMGRFSLRDVQLASGKLVLPTGSQEQVPPLATIEVAFLDSDVEVLQHNREAIVTALEQLKGIEDFLGETLQSAHAPDLKPLASLLSEIHHLLNEHLARREPGPSDLKQDAPEAVHADAQNIGIPPAHAETSLVRSREDVIHLLDQICTYYERCEPSSPVPLLLKRARRLVSKNFLEIMRDLAPNGLTQAEIIYGRESGEES